MTEPIAGEPPEPTEGQTLPFHWTPADEPLDRDGPNPHAQATTNVPDVVEALQAEFGDDFLDASLYAGEHTVLLRAARIADACRFLAAQHGFTYLVDLGAADRFTEADRFEVFYNLVDLEGRRRLRLKVRVDEDHPVVPTVTGVYPAANWNEREAWDMMGVRFEGHEDLRRMYMPEDFEYHPQRKEFPLLGVPGSLPLPPQTPEGPLTMDPFAAAHGSKPVKSYEEPESTRMEEDEA